MKEPETGPTKEAWQSAVAIVRDKNVGRLQGYLDTLDKVITRGALGEKTDRNLVDALKTAIHFFDPSKEEKVSSIGRARNKEVQDSTTVKMELKPADEARLRKLID